MRDTGFEPDVSPLITKGLQPDCDTYCDTGQELAEIVEGWAGLSPALRAGVLAIVRNANRDAQHHPPVGVRPVQSPSQPPLSQRRSHPAGDWGKPPVLPCQSKLPFQYLPFQTGKRRFRRYVP